MVELDTKLLIWNHNHLKADSTRQHTGLLYKCTHKCIVHTQLRTQAQRRHAETWQVMSPCDVPLSLLCLSSSLSCTHYSLPLSMAGVHVSKREITFFTHKSHNTNKPSGMPFSAGFPPLLTNSSLIHNYKNSAAAAAAWHLSSAAAEKEWRKMLSLGRERYGGRKSIREVEYYNVNERFGLSGQRFAF